MSDDDLGPFNEDLQQKVNMAASQEGAETSTAAAFTDHMFGVLTDAGVVDDPLPGMYEARGARASGYEVSDDEATLHVFITDYRSRPRVQPLGRAELETHLRRLTSFVDLARNGLWRRLEDTAAAWEMAQHIEQVWDRVGELRLTLLTNAVLRTDPPRPPEHEGRPVHLEVWDLQRLQRLASSGRVQEPISVDLVELWGAPIPCLGPHGEPGTYEAYLMTLPGELLARIYEIHGPRLLELNVRSYLQARVSVNRGMQETLRDAPQRFLAYNNGVSMTASSVDVVDDPHGGRAITAIRDLQIVNGGQTTASLHYAKVRTKTDLSQVDVQAKLSVVQPNRLTELVPRISQYANSQNRINTADFTANHPLHVALEKLSRTVWAPSPDGSHRMSHWYYERARGQYADALARERTPARQRAFKRVNPPNQRLLKTDVAKYDNTWEQLPWLVSLGGEKNFREFMLRVEELGRADVTTQDFEDLVAKAVLFRSTERIFNNLHLGAYRAPTVTYTLARISNDTSKRLDLPAIWRGQAVPDPLAQAITTLVPMVHHDIIAAAGTRNVTEWAKKRECWQSVLAIKWRVPVALGRSLLTKQRSSLATGDRDEAAAASPAERASSETDSSSGAVAGVSSQTWFEISHWAKETDNLTTLQRSLAFSLGRIAAAGRPASEKQTAQGLKILDEIKGLGFAPSAG